MTYHISFHIQEREILSHFIMTREQWCEKEEESFFECYMEFKKDFEMYRSQLPRRSK